jgi:hypothetical protein
MWTGRCKRGLSGGLMEIAMAVVVRSNRADCWDRTRCREAGRWLTLNSMLRRGLEAAALLAVDT